jgi:PilZ domain
VRLSGAEHESCGFTQDLSAQGTFFYTDFPLAVGEVIEVTLLMPSEITLGESMRVRCQGTVLRVMQPAVGPKLGVAVHFTGYEYLAEAARHEVSDSFTRISSLHGRAEEEQVKVRPETRRVAS